jgi:hypothetical protein
VNGPEKRRFFGRQFFLGLGLLLLGILLSFTSTLIFSPKTTTVIWVVPLYGGGIWMVVGLAGWLYHLRSKG